MMRDIDGIKSKAEFLEFLEELQHDLQYNRPDWENPTLEGFLEAMAAWIEDSDNYHRITGRGKPMDGDWQFLANVLAAARIYE